MPDPAEPLEAEPLAVAPLGDDVVDRPRDFLPADFTVPAPLVTPRFRLEPLTAAHNAEDLEAWTSSIDHIRATPGFVGRDWPSRVLTAAENERDLRRHADDFLLRKGFTYAVLDAANRSYVGCLYLYPARSPEHDVEARSWVRVSRATDDKPLHDAVAAWLRAAWPWQHPAYAPR